MIKLEIGKQYYCYDNEPLTNGLCTLIDISNYVETTIYKFRKDGLSDIEFSIASEQTGRIHDLESLQCCPYCGSVEIESKMWVNPNTGQTGEYVDGEKDWCTKCEDECTSTVYAEYLKEKKDEEDKE